MGILDIKHRVLMYEGHDMNTRVNIFIREQMEDRVNQNDTWHGPVSIENIKWSKVPQRKNLVCRIS